MSKIILQPINLRISPETRMPVNVDVPGQSLGITGKVLQKSVTLQPIGILISPEGRMPIRFTMPQQSMRIRLTNPTVQGADKHYETPFTVAEVLEVQHNLNKKPAITIIDSAGDEVEAEILHVDDNNVLVTMSAANSGVVICN